MGSAIYIILLLHNDMGCGRSNVSSFEPASRGADITKTPVGTCKSDDGRASGEAAASGTTVTSYHELLKQPGTSGFQAKRDVQRSSTSDQQTAREEQRTTTTDMQATPGEQVISKTNKHTTREVQQAGTTDQLGGSRRVQTIAVRPSTSERQAIHSADHSDSDRVSQAPYQSVSDEVEPNVGGQTIVGLSLQTVKKKKKKKKGRRVCHRNTSTTDLQPNSAMREESSNVVLKEKTVKIVHVDRVVQVPVYKDKIVERIVHVDRVVKEPQVSDLDVVVQASKSLEHTLRVNFSAIGKGLGKLMKSAAETHGWFESSLWNMMKSIRDQRNSIVHEARTENLYDRGAFLEEFKFVWLSLEEISCCREYCDFCNSAELLYSSERHMV